MGYTVKTDSDYMAVSVDMVELQAKIDPDTEDTLLTQYIKSATDFCEKYLGYPILEKVLVFHFDSLAELMELTVGVTSIVSITYDIPGGAADQVFSSDNYSLTNSLINEVKVPAGNMVESENVRVEVRAGKADAANISHNTKLAVMVLVSHYYNKRDNHVKTLPERVEALLDLDKVIYYEA